jgi:hypothetical protein
MGRINILEIAFFVWRFVTKMRKVLAGRWL